MSGPHGIPHRPEVDGLSLKAATSLAYKAKKAGWTAHAFRDGTGWVMVARLPDLRLIHPKATVEGA